MAVAAKPNSSQTAKVLEYIAKVAVYLTMFTPLVISTKFYFPFVGPKSLYFMALTQIAFFSYLGFLFLIKKRGAKFGLIGGALFIFLGSMILSGVLGVNPSYSFWSNFERMTGILMFFHLIAFFWVVVSMFREQGKWQNLFQLSLAISLILAVMAFLGKAMGLGYIASKVLETGESVLPVQSNLYFILPYLLLGMGFLVWKSLQKRWQEVGIFSLFFFLPLLIFYYLGGGGSTRSGATIGNTSFLGTYLLFNFFFAVYLLIKNKSWFLRLIFALSAVSLFFAVYISNAKAATLSILGGAFLLGMAFLAFGVKKKFLQVFGKIMLVLCFLVFIVGGVMFFQGNNIVRETFVKYATNSRLVVWKTAWQGIQEKPILGWGPENFEFVFDKYFNPCMFLPKCGGEIWFDRAHNIVFDTLVSGGVVGLAAYLFIFLAIFFVLLRAFFRKKLGFWECFVPIAILVAYTVQNLTVFDMISSYLMFFLVLAFSQAIIHVQAGDQITKTAKFKISQWREKVYASPKLIPISLVVFFCIFIYGFVWQPIIGATAVIDALKAQDLPTRLDAYKTAFSVSSMGIFQTREFLANNTESSIQKLVNDKETLAKANKDAIKQELDLSIGALEQNLAGSPLDFRSILRLAGLYNLYSYFDSSKLALAEKYGLQAIQDFSTNQQGYWALAQTRINQGKFQDALNLSQQALDLQPEVEQAQKIFQQVKAFASK